MVDFYADRTPSSAWHEIGTCFWAGRHPVLAVEQVGGQWRLPTPTRT